MNVRRYDSYERRGAFTLLELLVSIAMFSVILAAINSVLYGSLRLRENNERHIERRNPKLYALSIMKRDFRNAVPTGEILAGPLIGENEGGINQRRDRLELYTSTGVLREDSPFGDIQKVEYALYESNSRDRRGGYFLIRSLIRNLLSTVEEVEEEQVLLDDVQSLEFTYYDGQNWLDSWDSTSQDPPMPLAIHALIRFLPYTQDNTTGGEIEGNIFSMEMMAPIVAVAAAEEEETADSETEETTETDESNESQPGGNQSQTGGNQTQSNQQRTDTGGGGRAP
ncbi:MAG: prepilin-type N-terminal cleavage/methylation domain-containing protein [Candidatus Omnitrophota bacterium]|jgi:type II secretion system protein J|nr:MAG: prepilin-type N-terminal cleavage/methylation domain-containing protein [Candidatus Omnitrophota bacterium]